MSARRLVAALCSIATLLGFALVLSSPASAATPLHWGKGHAVDPMHGGLVSVSCASRSFCLAGGANGDVRRWNGARWAEQSVLDKHNAGIGDIDCVSPSFCAAAIESREGAYRPATFDGTRWAEAPHAVEGAGAGAISCVSARMCVLTSNAGDYQLWNGRQWTAPKRISSVQGFGVRAACATAHWCLAAFTDGPVFRFDGSSWHQVDSQSLGQLAGLQCPNRHWCMGVDFGGDWARYKHGTWGKQHSFGRQTTSLSCSSTAYCIAGDGNGGVATYSAGQWHVQRDVAPPFAIVSVSCSTKAFCAAVSYDGHSVLRTSGRWRRPAATDLAYGSVDDVSCASTTFCAAVDFSGAALTYTRSGWAAPKRVPREPNALEAVSCPTTSFCMAIDPNGFLTRTHGTWSAPKDLHESLGELSCASPRLCVATTFAGDVLGYNGHRWHTILTSQTEWTALSCATGSAFCMLVSGDGKYVTLTGDQLSAPVTTGDRSGFFAALSCSSNAFCAAVDGNNRLLEWTHSAWTKPIHPKGGKLIALSCTSRTFCIAVGGNHSATFTASGWSAVHRVAGASGLSAVSCVGHTFCAAVDENTGSAFIAR